MHAPEIHGNNTAEFSEVRRVLEANFVKRGERGASVCIWHGKDKVVDLWAGTTDKSREEPWQENTITTMFSSTKGLVALCFLMLADRGEFSYDQPVSMYWPEFAAEGKEAISIRTFLNHRSGLITIDTPISLEDLEERPEDVATLAAAQKPFWQPGEDQGYHAVTYGIYAAEIFKRIANESLGSFFAREVASPLHIDVFIGLPADKRDELSQIYPANFSDKLFQMVPKMLFSGSTEGRVYRSVAFGGDAAKAFSNPKELGIRGIENFNSSQVHAMELPWGNGIGNARGMAKIYAALANGGEIDGVRLVSPQAIEPLLARQSWSERDRVLCKPQGWSQGFIKEDTAIFSPNTESFGHPGAGGALGWCDPTNHLAIAYIPNKMATHIRSPRARALVAAAYRSIGLP